MPKHSQQQLILVDEKDRVLALEPKEENHKNPVPLHRAISILLFNKNKDQILITQRAENKKTWPLFWSNAVCSHPYFHESYQQAAKRRLEEELGIKTKLKEVLRFIYEAQYDKTWGEHEYDVVFEGSFEGEIKPHEDEISSYRWVEIKQLKKEARKNPKKFTPWFKIILEKIEL